jgi:WD40 repeat protein
VSSRTDGPLLFVSYAHEDKELCRRLVLMLGLVVKARGYDVWWDQTMVAGPWREQIEASLHRAVAGIVLVSEFSLTSSFVMEEELPKLLARGKVAPVYGRPCPWQTVPLIASLQFLGSAERALAEMDESRGELAAALSDLAKQAPHFFGLDAPTVEPAAASPDEARGGAGRAADPSLLSEQPGALYGVPELPDGYFERTVELDQLRSRLLTGLSGSAPFGLHGIGGIGKTVLATALARDLAVRRAFPDGIYWVVLGERADPVAAQARLARLAGLDADFRTVEDGISTLCQEFRNRRALVVVDDAWSAADAEALLVTGLEGRVLFTTRHALVLDRLRAERLPVDRLSPADARRFLAQVTRQHEPLPPEADQLIEALGGVVLALALLGATITHGTSWSQSLADVQRAGDVFRDESFANQFKGMQVAWEALADEARRRYRELAVFAEDVSIPILTVGRLWRYTAALEQQDAEVLCNQLAQRNLLTLEDGVRFHDLQRAFLQLQTSDSARAHRHVLAAHADVPAVPERWSTLPDDEPYLWHHLVEHLVAAGDVAPLEDVLTDPVWLLRRYHLHGPHAPEADLQRGLEALPTYDTGVRVLHRLRQVSHLLGSVTTLGDRALTFAHQMGDLISTEALNSFFPPVQLHPGRGLPTASDALERVLTGHVGGVWSVAWSPDRRRLASAGLDGTVRIWDVDAAGRQTGVLDGHGCAVRSVAWSPDGGRLASGADDGRVRIWDGAAPAKPRAVFSGHQASVWSVAWSPDGRRVASSGSDSTVRVWDLDAKERPARVLTGHEGSVWSVAWSPDGLRLASGGADRTVRVWPLIDEFEERPAVLGSHDGWAWSVAWSPDGRQVASAGDRSVRIWDAVATGGSAARLTAHDGLVWSVAWSPDGRCLASGSADHTVRVWDLERPDEPAVMTGHEDHVWSVAWSPDGRRVISGAHDETVRVWDTGIADRPSEGATTPGRWVWSVAWSPDGRRVVSGAEDGPIRVWDPDDPLAPVAEVDMDGGIWSVACSPDGELVATAGADRIIRLWPARNWDAPLTELAGHFGLVRSVAFAPDGRRLASVADDATVRLWDLPAPGHGGTILNRAHPMRARSVVWSPDGGGLATGNDDGSLRVWDLNAPDAPPRVHPKHRGRVESVAWSPDGRGLATAGLDGVLCVWDAADLTGPAWTWEGTGEPITAVTFSPDGRRLISGGEDRTVRLWDVSSGAPVTALGLGSMVCSLAWRDTRIAVGMATSWTVLFMQDPLSGPDRGR